jgi:murein biosynthesis integral membrane protein MurJ
VSGDADDGVAGRSLKDGDRLQSSWVTAAALIAGVTVVARIIGFLRFIVLARTVGTSCLGDVYATANAVPNIIFEVVVGGALVAVVVPLVAGALESDPARVKQTIAALHGWALVLLVPITALMYLASPLVIDVLLGSGNSTCNAADTSHVAQQMLWVFLLQIPVYGATVVAQGALQAHHRFFAPAVAPAVSSLVVIAGYLWYASLAGDNGGSLAGLTTTEFWAIAGGTTLGVFALLAVQIPALVRADLVVMPRLNFPPTRSTQARTLAWAGAVVVASQWMAYALAIRWSNEYGAEGSALVFVLAWTVFLLPWSVLALPIATSTFPRLATLHERGDNAALHRTTSVSVRSIIAISAAGAAGLAAAAVPLAVIIVRGVPGVERVSELSLLLAGLSAGVLAYGVQGHLVRVLAAQHRAPLAAWGTASGWLVGIVVAWWGASSAGDVGELSLAIGIGFSVGLTVAAIALAAFVGMGGRSAALHGAGRTLLVAVVSGAVVGTVGYLLFDNESVSIVVAIAEVLAAGVIALAVVVGASALVDRDLFHELRHFRSAAEGMASMTGQDPL